MTPMPDMELFSWRDVILVAVVTVIAFVIGYLFAQYDRDED